MARDQGILPYYPKRQNPHLKGTREIFYGYGNPKSVDVNVGTLDDGSNCINFVLDRVLKCNNTDLNLVPSSPPRTLVSTNHYHKVTEEPCLSKLKKEEEDEGFILSALSKFSFHAKRPRDKVIRILNDKIERLRNGERETSARENAEGKRINSSLLGIYKHHGKLLGKYRAAWRREYNQSYAGGCLSFQPIENDDEGVVFYSTGKFMNEIACRCTVLKDQSHLTLSKETGTFKFDSESPVKQVTTATLRGQTLCLSRTNRKFSLLKLDRSEGMSLKHLASYSLDDADVSFVSLSPHLLNECLVASENGTVRLWSLERKSKEIYKVPLQADPVDREVAHHATHCHFTSHPRCFSVTTTNSINLVDARARDTSSSTLVVMPPNGERITCSYKPNPNTQHLLYASQLSLFVADERFPQHPILTWDHALLSPPTFMDSLNSILGVEGESLIAYGNQGPREVHCLQTHNVGTPFGELDLDPARAQICGSPWKIWNMGEVQSGSTVNVEKRLTCPHVGVCLVPHRSTQGFSIMQLSSVGDIFCQDFRADRSYGNRSKMFSGDLDLESWKLEECIEVCCAPTKEYFTDSDDDDDVKNEMMMCRILDKFVYRGCSSSDRDSKEVKVAEEVLSQSLISDSDGSVWLPSSGENSHLSEEDEDEDEVEGDPEKARGLVATVNKAIESLRSKCTEVGDKEDRATSLMFKLLAGDECLDSEGGTFSTPFFTEDEFREGIDEVLKDYHEEEDADGGTFELKCPYEEYEEEDEEEDKHEDKKDDTNMDDDEIEYFFKCIE